MLPHVCAYATLNGTVAFLHSDEHCIRQPCHLPIPMARDLSDRSVFIIEKPLIDVLLLVQADGIHLTTKAQCWLGRALAQEFKKMFVEQINIARELDSYMDYGEYVYKSNGEVVPKPCGY